MAFFISRILFDHITLSGVTAGWEEINPKNPLNDD